MFDPDFEEAGQQYLYMDDYAVCLVDTEPTRLKEKLRRLLSYVHEFGWRHKFSFDLGSTKTAILYINAESAEACRGRFKFGEETVPIVSQYRYLGFRFGTKRDDSPGLSLEPQQQYERIELARRIGWLSALAQGRHGAPLDVCTTAYISLIRSKMAFGSLLKAGDPGYVSMLEALQTRAMRVITSGLPSTPRHALGLITDLPTVESYLNSRRCPLYAGMLDANLDDINGHFEEYYATGQLGREDSPYGLLQLAYDEASAIWEPWATDIAGLVEYPLTGTAREVLHQAEFPKSTRRQDWSISRQESDPYTYYLDGGFMRELKLGSAACVTWEGQVRSTSFGACTSSKQAEVVALLKGTEQALLEDPVDQTLTYVSDSAALLRGLPNWPDKGLTQEELRILENLALLGKKGNRVRFRHVPSHLLEEDNAEYASLSLDVHGNARADAECSRLLSLTEPRIPGPVYTSAIRAMRRTHLEQHKPTTGVFATIIAPTLTRQALRKVRADPRKKATMLVWLLTGHLPIGSHFLYLKHKTRPNHPKDDPAYTCRFCSTALKTATHLMKECTSRTVRRYRQILEGINIQPSGDDRRDMAHLMLDQDNWTALADFFNAILAPRVGRRVGL